MKYVITHIKPIRIRSNGVDKMYGVGETVELNPNDPKTKQLLKQFKIMSITEIIDNRR